MLSDAAARRLVHYCRRVPLTEPEFVDEHGRQLRYVGGALREVGGATSSSVTRC